MSVSGGGTICFFFIYSFTSFRLEDQVAEAQKEYEAVQKQVMTY